MIKYFRYDRSEDWINCAYVRKAEEDINKYAKENNLEIVLVCWVRDKGIFVVFEEK